MHGEKSLVKYPEMGMFFSSCNFDFNLNIIINLSKLKQILNKEFHFLVHSFTGLT